MGNSTAIKQAGGRLVMPDTANVTQRLANYETTQVTQNGGPNTATISQHLKSGDKTTVSQRGLSGNIVHVDQTLGAL